MLDQQTKMLHSTVKLSLIIFAFLLHLGARDVGAAPFKNQLQQIVQLGRDLRAGKTPDKEHIRELLEDVLYVKVSVHQRQNETFVAQALGQALEAYPATWEQFSHLILDAAWCEPRAGGFRLTNIGGINDEVRYRVKNQRARVAHFLTSLKAYHDPQYPQLLLALATEEEVVWKALDPQFITLSDEDLLRLLDQGSAPYKTHLLEAFLPAWAPVLKGRAVVSQWLDKKLQKDLLKTPTVLQSLFIVIRALGLEQAPQVQQLVYTILQGIEREDIPAYHFKYLSELPVHLFDPSLQQYLLALMIEVVKPVESKDSVTGKIDYRYNYHLYQQTREILTAEEDLLRRGLEEIFRQWTRPDLSDDERLGLLNFIAEITRSEVGRSQILSAHHTYWNSLAIYLWRSKDPTLLASLLKVLTSIQGQPSALELQKTWELKSLFAKQVDHRFHQIAYVYLAQYAGHADDTLVDSLLDHVSEHLAALEQQENKKNSYYVDPRLHLGVSVCEFSFHPRCPALLLKILNLWGTTPGLQQKAVEILCREGVDPQSMEGLKGNLMLALQSAEKPPYFTNLLHLVICASPDGSSWRDLFYQASGASAQAIAFLDQRRGAFATREGAQALDVYQTLVNALRERFEKVEKKGEVNLLLTQLLRLAQDPQEQESLRQSAMIILYAFVDDPFWEREVLQMHEKFPALVELTLPLIRSEGVWRHFDMISNEGEWRAFWAGSPALLRLLSEAQLERDEGLSGLDFFSQVLHHWPEVLDASMAQRLRRQLLQAAREHYTEIERDEVALIVQILRKLQAASLLTAEQCQADLMSLWMESPLEREDVFRQLAHEVIEFDQ